MKVIYPSIYERLDEDEKEKALIISSHSNENAIIIFNNSINFATEREGRRQRPREK